MSRINVDVNYKQAPSAYMTNFRFLPAGSGSVLPAVTFAFATGDAYEYDAATRTFTLSRDEEDAYLDLHEAVSVVRGTMNHVKTSDESGSIGLVWDAVESDTTKRAFGSMLSKAAFEVKTRDERGRSTNVTLEVFDLPSRAELWKDVAIRNKCGDVARFLSTAPSNHLTPVLFCERVRDIMRNEVDNGRVDVEIIDEHQMRDMSMHCMLETSKASVNPPRMLIVRVRAPPPANTTTSKNANDAVNQGFQAITGGRKRRGGATTNAPNADANGERNAPNAVNAVANGERNAPNAVANGERNAQRGNVVYASEIDHLIGSERTAQGQTQGQTAPPKKTVRRTTTTTRAIKGQNDQEYSPQSNNAFSINATPPLRDDPTPTQSRATQKGQQFQAASFDSLGSLDSNVMAAATKTHLSSSEAGDNTNPPVCLVGKGVTFDTGGTNIKSTKGMESMHMDKTGASVVIGVLCYVIASGRPLPCDVIGVMPMIENMPDGNALKPRDVIGSYNGKTIEIDNTDAEGRLIFADAFPYAVERFRPKALLDFATLTGWSGNLFCDSSFVYYSASDRLASLVERSSEHAGERCMRMPRYTGYKRYTKSSIADLKNASFSCAGPGDKAGSGYLAAMFLSNFLPDDLVKRGWVHLDITHTVSQPGKAIINANSVDTGFDLTWACIEADAEEDGLIS